MSSTIIEDSREIEAVFDHDSLFRVGQCGVTRIEAYGEPAPYCLVPWFAVYKGDDIIWRVPAAGVRYKEANHA